jgi:hypothetical protein
LTIEKKGRKSRELFSSVNKGAPDALKERCIMNEKDGHRILNNSFRYLGGFSAKIHDQPFNPSIRFTPKKPFDDS